MKIFGLNPLDAAIIALYVIAMLWMGRRAQRRLRGTADFYIAGRKLGKVLQFFLNFGSSTNADQAVAVSREVYRQGISGMWIQYLVLFLTPFYWFTTMLFRRSRMITIGDWYTERFKSKFLGSAFAVFTLVMALIGGGVGFMVAGKTFQALTPKPEISWTAAERVSVEQYREFQGLRQKADHGLAAEERARYDELNERNKKGELKSYVSYGDTMVIYIIYGLIVGIYTIMGGFVAAVMTDVVQGFLKTIFSVLLVPLGLIKIGGFAGLHAKVPDYMFQLFGSATMSEYAWYTILAMVLANLVSIIASAPMMQTAGSARDENTARFGMLSGMFFKRFLMIFWALTGLLALGLFGGQLHDPDLIWGFMTLKLLFPGAIGLMLAGVLAANMSALSASSVTYSALFIKNLYEPFVKPKSERHLINIGRVIIALTLAGGMGSALFVGNLLDLFKYFISIPAVFGASIWIGFLWRRLTKWAVIIQVAVCFVIYAVIPNVFQTMDWVRRNPNFLQETRLQVITLETKAVQADVDAGRASKLGEKIRRQHTIEPTGIFFEKVAKADPLDPKSPKIGLGRFEAEVWVLSLGGIDFSGFTKAQLNAARFFFDALFPFVLLVLISLVTKPAPKPDLDRFFGKIHTPVQMTPEEDQRAVEEAGIHPEKFEKHKIWPRSNWEIMKPSRMDYIGFFGTWALVGVIILLLWLMVTIK